MLFPKIKSHYNCGNGNFLQRIRKHHGSFTTSFFHDGYLSNFSFLLHSQKSLVKVFR